MKFRTILCAFAATMMLFSACGKDDDSNSGNGGGNQPNIADNTVVYDDHTYTVDLVEVDYYNPSLTLVDATSSVAADDGSPSLEVHGIHITPDIWNRDIDLTNLDQWTDGMVVDLMFVWPDQSIEYQAYYNGDKDISGLLDGVSYEHESIFTRATYHVSGNNDGTPITVTLDAVLKNGKTLQMKIVTGNYNVN